VNYFTKNTASHLEDMDAYLDMLVGFSGHTVLMYVHSQVAWLQQWDCEFDYHFGHGCVLAFSVILVVLCR